MINWIYSIQIVQYKVEQTRSSGCWSIKLSRLIDLMRSYLCFGDLKWVNNLINFTYNILFAEHSYNETTFLSISAAVFFVVSKFSTKAVSPNMFSPAEDKRDSKSSSKAFNWILNSFCCFVNSAYEIHIVLLRIIK